MSAAADLSRLRVLIVDDNHHMINIVKTILRGFGIKDYFEARDAAEAFDIVRSAEAFDIVRSAEVDLIIVDFLMNLLDGIDFIRLVRTAADSPNPYVPIIMLTAYSERTKVEAARDAGTTEFCCKPVTASELYRKVASVINHPRPFVRTALYFGPDRRRRSAKAYTGPERRKSAAASKAS